ncbi:dual CXXC motif small (seleno)protein [Desulfosudis oleivorans]
MRCRFCNASFTPEQYTQQMDEEFENRLADVRCDRI